MDAIEKDRRRNRTHDNLRKWLSTRGTANRYHWKERYEVIDGKVYRIYTDGSGGPVDDGRDHHIDLSPENVAKLLNDAARTAEQASLVDGENHGRRGDIANLGGFVRMNPDATAKEVLAKALELYDRYDEKRRADLKKIRFCVARNLLPHEVEECGKCDRLHPVADLICAPTVEGGQTVAPWCARCITKFEQAL